MLILQICKIFLTAYCDKPTIENIFLQSYKILYIQNIKPSNNIIIYENTCV